MVNITAKLTPGNRVENIKEHYATIDGTDTNYTRVTTKLGNYGKRGHLLVFVSGEPRPEDVDGSGIDERPVPGAQGVNEADDKAWRKYNRMEVKIMRAIVGLGLEMNNMEALNIRFSRKAGCGMCPCSPGFIVEVDGQYLGGKALYITVG